MKKYFDKLQATALIILFKSIVACSVFCFWFFTLGHFSETAGIIAGAVSALILLIVMNSPALPEDHFAEVDYKENENLSELQKAVIITGTTENAAKLLLAAYIRTDSRKALNSVIEDQNTGQQFYLEFRKKRNLTNENLQAPYMRGDMPQDKTEKNNSLSIAEAHGSTETQIQD